jgi:hypothetical protein
MDYDRMLGFDDAVQLVIKRLGCRTAQAKNIVRDAYTSGEVDTESAWIRWVGGSGIITPASIHPKGPEGRVYNPDDLASWLDEKHGIAAAKDKQQSKTPSAETLESLWSEWPERETGGQDAFWVFCRSKGITDRPTVRKFHNKKRGGPGSGRPPGKSAKLIRE